MQAYQDLERLCSELAAFQQKYPGNSFLDTIRAKCDPVILPDNAPRPNLALMWEIGSLCQGLLATRTRYLSEQRFIAAASATQALDRALPDVLLGVVVSFLDTDLLARSLAYTSRSLRKAACLDRRFVFVIPPHQYQQLAQQRAFFFRFGEYMRRIVVPNMHYQNDSSRWVACWPSMSNDHLVKVVRTWKRLATLELAFTGIYSPTSLQQSIILRHLPTTAFLTSLTIECLDVDFTSASAAAEPLFPALTHLSIACLNPTIDHNAARIAHHLPRLQELETSILTPANNKKNDARALFARRHLSTLTWECRKTLERVTVHANGATVIVLRGEQCSSIDVWFKVLRRSINKTSGCCLVRTKYPTVVTLAPRSHCKLMVIGQQQRDVAAAFGIEEEGLAAYLQSQPSSQFTCGIKSFRKGIKSLLL